MTFEEFKEYLTNLLRIKIGAKLSGVELYTDPETQSSCVKGYIIHNDKPYALSYKLSVKEGFFDSLDLDRILKEVTETVVKGD